MKINIYDTHVKTKAGERLHFDVLVDETHEARVKEFSEKYLLSLGINLAQIDTKSCQFCHSEIARPKVQSIIKQHGHYVLPLSGF